jgi:hypothetical protein
LKVCFISRRETGSWQFISTDVFSLKVTNERKKMPPLPPTFFFLHSPISKGIENIQIIRPASYLSNFNFLFSFRPSQIVKSRRCASRQSGRVNPVNFCSKPIGTSTLPFGCHLQSKRKLN